MYSDYYTAAVPGRLAKDDDYTGYNDSVFLICRVLFCTDDRWTGQAERYGFIKFGRRTDDGVVWS